MFCIYEFNFLSQFAWAWDGKDLTSMLRPKFKLVLGVKA